MQPKSLLTSALVSASSSGCWAEGVPPVVVGVLSQLPYSSDRSAPLAERAEGALPIGDSPALSARSSSFAVGILWNTQSPDWDPNDSLITKSGRIIRS